MSPEAYLAHSVPGRLRLKVPSMRGDQAYFERLGAVLSQRAGVDAVVINAATASVLIGHDGLDAGELGRLGEEAGLFRLRPAAYDPLWQRAHQGLEMLDQRMARFSRGELGMRSALLLALVGMALRQASRGQMLGPATTLLWYALQLVGLPAESGRTTRPDLLKTH